MRCSQAQSCTVEDTASTNWREDSFAGPPPKAHAGRSEPKPLAACAQLGQGKALRPGSWRHTADACAVHPCSCAPDSGALCTPLQPPACCLGHQAVPPDHTCDRAIVGISTRSAMAQVGGSAPCTPSQLLLDYPTQRSILMMGEGRARKARKTCKICWAVCFRCVWCLAN